MRDLPDQLRVFVSDDGVLTEPADLAGYRGDLARPEGGPILCVVRPRNAAETARIVRACAKAGVPITPRGGGTGLAGGATPLPAAGSVIVSFERMRRIRSIDIVDDVMIVEAGAVLAEIQRAAEENNRLIGLDHGGAGSSQIGGNLATNAGGNNVIRYGMARDQVLGLEVVLANGDIVSDLSRLRKSNAGYNLAHLFVGSEGTLGLITAASLKLRPLPARRVTLCLGLRSLSASLDLLALARSIFGEAVSAFELMPRTGLDLHFRHTGQIREPFEPPMPWTVLVEADAASRHFALDAAADELLTAAAEAGIVTSGTVASSDTQRRTLWRLREGIAEAMIATPGSLKSDTAVPISAIPAFIERATDVVARIAPGVIPVPFGHVGDGNIHFNLLPPPEMDLVSFIERAPELARAIEDIALDLGGTVSAEHGIGSLKVTGLERMLSPEKIDAMKRVKAALDPKCLLNPLKMFRL